MCGIGGYSIPLKTKISDDILNIILEKIKHRGPDGFGFYTNSNKEIGLVHSRLAIQDLSPLGQQPMLSHDEQFVLVFNGEIYNFKELRNDLFKKGVQFKSSSDTEVLLNLYIDEGVNMLNKLDGIFAFAIWDQRNQSLFLARDNFGVKPLYYNTSDGKFFFSSELKALTSIITSKKNLNYNSIQSYLTFLYCPGSGTPIDGINKLLPGHAMTVNFGKITDIWKWYKEPIFQKIKKKNISVNEAVEGVRNHLKAAVKKQLISDAPIGAFLSGGLDSSSVVSFAKEHNKNINCFTVKILGDQEKGTYSDFYYARKVASYLDVPLNIVEISSNKLVCDFEAMVKMVDEPIADPASLITFYISKLAKEQGIKVLLSGVGGDDLFTGYRRHKAALTEHWWNWMPLESKKCLQNLSSRLNQENIFARRIKKILAGAHLNENDRLINYCTWIQQDELKKLYTPETKRKLKNCNGTEAMSNYLSQMADNTSKIDKILALEQKFFLADHNLLYTDRMSMAAGLEVRVPFLDKKLVEFAYTISDHFKKKKLIGKWILKKSLEGYLPQDVIYRPKTGFGAPVRQWMKKELREFLCDTLSFESIKRRGLFDPNAVIKLIADNQKGKIDASYTLFSLLCIEIWCKNNI